MYAKRCRGERWRHKGEREYFGFLNVYPHGFCVGEKEQLKEREITGIEAFIKKHYREMYLKWSEMSDAGFYEGR